MRRLRALALGLAAAGAVASCIRAGAPAGGPVAAGLAAAPEPTIRVGLVVGAPSATVGGGGALRVVASEAGLVSAIPAGRSVKVVAGARGLALAPDGGAPATVERVTLTPADSGGTVRVNGRDYAGEVTLVRDRTGLTAINRLGLESYLPGVIASEMGRRDASEEEALRAQAIVSRTYALRNLRRWDVQGFDLYATVADQVYGGRSAEYPLATEAVQATRGIAVTYGGRPIDAFFFSTCGGRTAEGTEVFRAADRPYLRSVSDVGPNGAWCRVSPRFHWTETWTGGELDQMLRRTLPAAAGVTTPVSEVRDVRVARRTGSGRVGQLAVATRGGELLVDGPQVRAVLRATSGEILRSNLFTLSATRRGRKLVRLEAEGSGAGHGVGFCQWGAVGRSRGGQRYDQILSAYYPSTALERLY